MEYMQDADQTAAYLKPRSRLGAVKNDLLDFAELCRRVAVRQPVAGFNELRNEQRMRTLVRILWSFR